MNRSSNPNAFVLVGILVIVMLASMIALSVVFRAQTEELAQTAGFQSDRSWAAAMSGVHAAMAMAHDAFRNPGMLDWQNAPERLKEQFVFDDGAEQWLFTVFTYDSPERPGVRHGLTDESSRLNANTASTEMLVNLPEMTPALADAIADYIDADDLPRLEGAEQDVYDQFPVPMIVPNERLSSLDQILLVRGFSPALFYGEDVNLNHLLEPNEDDGAASFPPDNSDGALDQGLRQYLTVTSYDANVDQTGLARVNLNKTGESLDSLDLPEPVRSFIEAARRNNARFEHPSQLLDLNWRLKDEQGNETNLSSSVTADMLPLFLDRTTTTNATRLEGLLNINTANVWVLQSLPQIDLTLAESIVAARAFLDPQTRRTPAWLLTEGLVDAAQFRQIAPLLTARSGQFRFQVVGYSSLSGHYRVLEAVVDAAEGSPRIVYLRDLTPLGPPFPLNPTSPSDA